MISIVVPVRNRAGIVGRTLDSIAAQTCAAKEIILVDNGSTDGTAEVLRAWAAGRDNVKVVSEPTPGATRARNRGLAEVTSPYVMFFDSDDYMPPRHVMEITNRIKAGGDADILVFDMNLVDLQGKVHPKMFRRGDLMTKHIFHSILSTQRFVVKTALARRVGGWNAKIPCWNDWEFGLRLLRANPRVEYVKLTEPVVAYAQKESITGTNFHSKHGKWELALDAADGILRGTAYRCLIDCRRAILAGEYRKEGHAEYAEGMVSGRRLKMVERYVSMGGRGVEYIARLLG